MLEDWSCGDQSVPDKLMPLVYDELRRLAHQHMRREKPGHTLQTAALVHEAYVRLVTALHKKSFRDEVQASPR